MLTEAAPKTGLRTPMRGRAPNAFLPLPGDSLHVHLQRIAQANHIPSVSALEQELGIVRNAAHYRDRVAEYCRIDRVVLDRLDDAPLNRLSGALKRCPACHRDTGAAPPLAGLRCIRVCVRHGTRLIPGPVEPIPDNEVTGAILLAHRFGIDIKPVHGCLPESLARLDGVALADLVNAIAAEHEDEGIRSGGRDKRLPRDSRPPHDSLAQAWSLLLRFPLGLESIWADQTAPDVTRVIAGFTHLLHRLGIRSAIDLVSAERARYTIKSWPGCVGAARLSPMLSLQRKRRHRPYDPSQMALFPENALVSPT